MAENTLLEEAQGDSKEIDKSALSAQREYQKWQSILDGAKRHFRKWHERSKKIADRYADERPSESDRDFNVHRFNILWSNIQTIMPSLYARTPKAEVMRRYKDRDDSARTASTILERGLQFEFDQYGDLDEALGQSVLDYLLAGRGTCWVRFEIEEIEEGFSADRPDKPELPPGVTEDMVMAEIEAMQEAGAPIPEQLKAFIEPEQSNERERSVVDWVAYSDFIHEPARSWPEVTWVARRVYMSIESLIERFGDVARQVQPTAQTFETQEDRDSTLGETPTDGERKAMRAEVWEIWDKTDRTVRWISPGLPQALEVKEDPYGLVDFFPCPKPLYATLNNKTLIPIPDFTLYQDQANELDQITQKINLLVSALKVAGMYDQSNASLADLIESSGNIMIPVDGWGEFVSKGGAKGSVDWMPMDMIVSTLTSLYAAREQTKQVIYEIIGMADIMRGSSNANETFGAQRIKTQFGSIRLSMRQKALARFVTEIMRIKAQFMMDKYSVQTLKEMSGIDDTDDAQFADSAIELIRSEPVRAYKIEVAADSLIAIDEAQDKADRLEFIGQAGEFMQRMLPVIQQQPELGKLAAEMLMFGVRSFKAGRNLENAFQQTIDSIEQAQQMAAQQPQQQQPDPAMMQIQANMQIEREKMQMQMELDRMQMEMENQREMMRIQADIQSKQAAAQLQAEVDAQRARSQIEVDQSRALIDAQTKSMDNAANISLQRDKMELDAATKIQIAGMNSAAQGVIQISPATDAAEQEIQREIKP